MTALTDSDRSVITRARELASAGNIASLQVVLDIEDETDPAAVLAIALGKAQFLLGELADIAEGLDRETSRLRNDRARYRTRLVLPPDDDDREALREAGQPGRLAAE